MSGLAEPFPHVKVTIGSLDDSSRGSGARKNEGKPQWWQLPLWALFDVLSSHAWVAGHTPLDRSAEVWRLLSGWQRGAVRISELLARAIELIRFDLAYAGQPSTLRDALAEVCRVLEKGAVKYPQGPKEKQLGPDGRPTPSSAGNWAKGMPWSVCFACAVSHYLYRMSAERTDKETGCLHSAHLATNLMFLSAYETLYPEGDDRMKEYQMTSLPAPSLPRPPKTKTGSHDALEAIQHLAWDWGQVTR